MTEIISLNVVRGKDDNTLVTPVELLRDALFAIEGGHADATSLMIIRLDRGEEHDMFDSGWWASNLSSAEMIALLEVVKVGVIKDMGYT